VFGYLVQNVIISLSQAILTSIIVTQSIAAILAPNGFSASNTYAFGNHIILVPYRATDKPSIIYKRSSL